MSNIKELDKKYIANTYSRFPLEIVSGKGSVVFDPDGNEYIDLGSGIAVTSFGISDSVWVEAVTSQLNKVQHTSNLFYTEPSVILAEKLCCRTGMKKVFFSNSGAEANECAIKAARKYAAKHKGTDCFTIITLENSFHGRTLTTLAATGQEHYHELYQPLTPGFIHTPSGNIENLKKLVAENNVAAIMIECIQGEGGVIPQPPEFVKTIETICRDNDIIFIVDEVQTGNGRTGELYAYMNYGVKPDIITTAKGIGGGLPLGACIFGEKVENIFEFGDHGSTFGANPVCCAGAISIIDRIDYALLSEVKSKSEYIFKELSYAKGIKSVSGMGLMIGVETEKPVAEVVNSCIKNGVLCLTAKNKVRLLPALNIPFELLEKSIAILKRVCAEE